MAYKNVRARVELDIELAKARRILENIDRITPVNFVVHVRVGIARRVIVVVFLRDNYPDSERHHEGDSGC
jgi:hypothetical protein